MQSPIFFNKEGDNLNFRYNEDDELWQGDIIFHQNSDDTFKTAGLYVFEKIPSFEYERPGDLQLEKFQLFNEYGFDIYGSAFFTQSIYGIELPNTDPNFYSKWIYGTRLNRYFPVGSQIRFNKPILEFQNPNVTYTVVKTKKNGIMILSDVDNRSFNEQYGNFISDNNNFYSSFTVSGTDGSIVPTGGFTYSIGGVNSIGIYDYIKPDLTENVSSWSEPNFYDRLFNGRVLNLIGTEKNDGIYTVKNIELNDKVYSRYIYDARLLKESYDVLIDITIKTELPTVYSGPVTVTGSRVEFGSRVPTILKPGVEFYLPDSNINSNRIVISDIPQYSKINQQQFFATGSQVLYNNLIYECIQSHTWSYTLENGPSNAEFWKRSFYVPVVGTLSSENFFYTEIHLVKNRFTYSQSFTQSMDVTFGSSVQKYAEDLKFYNIDYYYDGGILHADLMYPSDYADVRFFLGSSSFFEVTNKKFIKEKNIETEEILKPEIVDNFSKNYDYTIVFTDVDEFGIRFTINDQIYYEDVEFLYDGLDLNLERTIDKTLRNWFTSWYIPLARLGVIPKLKFSGKSFSPYFNAISLTTEYPNVPLKFKVEVGTTANFYIPRKQVILNKLGSNLDVIINGRTYGILCVSNNGVVDIISTLENWIDTYSEDGILYTNPIDPDLGGGQIYVEQILTMLFFKVKEMDVRIEISVNPGISVLPGSKDFLINDLFEGNVGALLTSNSVVLKYATYSFEEELFSTGQVLSVNNSVRVWNNQEYNIEYLGPRMMNLSYQGPFWPTLDPICDISPYVTIALSADAYGATGCSVSVPFSPSGEFNLDFRSDFSVYFGASNSYVIKNDFNTNDKKRFVDIIYLGLAKRIYVMGERLTIIDSITGFIMGEVELPNIVTGISLNFNEYNNYLYCLSDSYIYVVDPLYPKLDYTIPLTLNRTAFNMGINPDNGDVYVSYGDNQIDIWYQDNFLSTPSKQYPDVPDSKNYYRFGYNKSEKDMYVTADNYLVRFNGSDRTLQYEYQIDGLKPDIFYQPQNSSFYVFNTDTILNVNGGDIIEYNLGLKISDWLKQPTGTTSNLSDIYFFDKDTAVAVGANGTILKTTNAGENWNKVTTAVTTNINTLSIIKSGSFEGTLVAAGDSGRILTSTDYGDTWSVTTQGINKFIDIKFYSPTKGFLLVETTGGNNLIQLNYNGTPVQGFSIGIANTKMNSIWGNDLGSFIVVVGTQDQILVSTSHFAQNSTSQIRRTRLNSVSTVPSSNFIVTVGDSGVILRTTDKTDWHTRYAGTTRNYKSVTFPTSTVGWLVGASGSIARTGDSGLNWTGQNSGISTTFDLNSVHASDSSTVLAAGDGGSIVWNESGTWNQHLTLTGTRWTQNKLNGAFLINKETKIVVGDSGTILRVDPLNYRKINTFSYAVVGTYSSDGIYNNTAFTSQTDSGANATFDIIISNSIVTSVQINNRGKDWFNSNKLFINNAGLGGYSNGYIEITVNSTISTFDNIPSGTNNNLNAVFFVGGFGVIVGNNGTCLQSSNGGVNWVLKTLGGVGTTNLFSVAGSANTFWVCGAGGKIWKSSDGGNSWGGPTTIGIIDLTSISFKDISNGTVVDAYGRIYTTTDGGSSWQRNYFDYNSVHFFNDSVGLVAGRNGIVLKTTDGGNLWDYVHIGTTASLSAAYLAAENIAYVAGTDGLIRKSSTGVRSSIWINQDSGSSNLKNFAFTDALTGYVVGDGGIIFKTEKDPPLVRNLAFDNINSIMHLSTPEGITTFDLEGNLINKGLTPDFGPIVMNQFDGDIYLASQVNQQLYVYDSKRYYFKYSKYFSDGRVKKVIYNPDRQGVMGIIPNNIVQLQSIFEITVSIGAEISNKPFTYSYVGENNYGTLDPNYIPRPSLWLKTREYIRRPRANYNDEPNVQLIWSWEEDQTPEIFLYDFSGDQLVTGTRLSYTGPKPLPLVALNRKVNKNLDRTELSEFQQTIFDEIKQTLVHVDYSEDLSLKPTPIEIFMGVNSQNEGVLTSVLNLYKREDISFTVIPNSTNSDVIHFSIGVNDEIGLYGMIVFDNNSTMNFRQTPEGVSRGLKPNQLLRITVIDNVNNKNKYISLNNGITVKIRSVFTKYLIVDFIEEILTDEFTQIDNYPKSGNITYLTVTFQVVDKLIGRFNIHSQTEIEDIRYKIELSNTGHLVDPYDSFIFKEYDINEQGVDWTFLNRKRKEMLMVRDQIFPYIGSYKSLINAINFFGYNDLELYEYYRNIDINSKDFYKLFKIEIPDIFDTSVAGWTENDFIKHTLPNPKFEDTNLFNLTFKITDKEGTNVLQYSLAEVLMKLQGLKIWLEKKVIPITHRILDITGRADFVGVNSIQHECYDVKIINSRQELTPIDFALTEAYLMPINSGSTVYTCHVEFFMGYVPTYSVAPDYFNVKIRTYKTYKEWNPFTTYQIGDRVIYYDVIYESVMSNNKLRNPRKYRGIPTWAGFNDYTLGDYSNYNREIYQYIGTQSSFVIFGSASTVNPYQDISNNGAYASWFNMTEWKNVDLVPVQTLQEYRITATFSLEVMRENPPPPGEQPPPIKAGKPFNFTVDSNIDPFIVIEVTSDNGYGQIYTTKKNYEIRGLNDISDPIRGIEQIGPFQPLTKVGNSL